MFLAARKKNTSYKPLQISIGQNRIPWVYDARGIAIMLIVYRHVVLGMKFSGVEVSPIMYNLQMLFFNFRMPAFFILSGVFIVKSLKRRSEIAVAKDKVSNLLYPYILWACITLLLQICFKQFSNARREWDDFENIILHPRALDQLWYLFALFNTSILFLFLNKISGNNKWVQIAVAIALHVLSFYLTQYDFFSDFFYFYGYFLTGALLSDALIDPKRRDKILKISYLKWIFPLFVIGQWFWFTHQDSKGYYEFIFLVINYIGCYFLFMVALLISKSNRNEWLTIIGRYSLYIYILHVQIAAIIRKILRDMYPEIDPWLLLSICFISGIVLPVLIVSGFKKYGIERLFTLKPSHSS
ncbi:MAG: acyltransferase family protein [Flavisolibacter sp.]|jgi:fucose 4-O-acetylase-like acetyltransferase